MTHYTIRYDETGDAKRRKALSDIRDWLGKKRYEAMTEAYRAMPQPKRHGFALQMSFAGVSGFPVHAWYETLWNPTQHDMHVFDYYLK